MPGIQRALVTGASGFIGGALTLRLLAEGTAIRAVCRDLAKGRFLKGADIVQGDVQDAGAMRRYAEGCDVIFHLAAVGSGSTTVHYRANVQGTENVAGAAHAAGAARLVHVSSVAVYGYDIAGPIFETHEQRPSPRDFYQQSKAMGEQAAWAIARRTGLALTVVRPAFVYGPRSPFWTVAMYEACRRLPFVPDFGDATAHPIYIDDLVDLLLIMATHPAAPGHAFNASADPPATWNEFLSYYARMAGNIRRRRIPTAALVPLVRPLDWLFQFRGRPRDISGTLKMLSQPAVYRMDKAENLLGWHPRVSLAEGMARTETWLQSRKQIA